MATYGPQQVPSTGLAATYNAAGGSGDRVPPGAIIHVKNGNASPLSVTFDVVLTLDGDLAVPDRVISGIPATTGERFVRVPNNEVYRDPADGLVKMTCSPTASVTFAVIS